MPSSLMLRCLTGVILLALATLLYLADLPQFERLRDANLRQPADKPWFVIHLGPPKTATTTLETEMTNFIHTLGQDNYLYLGKFYPFTKTLGKRHRILEILRDLKCQEERRKSRKTKCWNEMMELLKPLRGTNIFLSDEEFGFRWTDFPEGESPIDWISLQKDIGKHWNILAIIGYRRLHEWIPSARQQNDRWFKGRRNRRIMDWPSPHGKGSHLSPLFPMVLEYPQISGNDVTPKFWFHYFTDDILRNLQNYRIPYKMFHMYHKEPLRSFFLCNILPDAPLSCAESRRLDLVREEMRANPAQTESLYYDAVATHAAARGWVDTVHFTRHEAAEVLQLYQETERNGTAYDLPQKCPSTDELNLLLRASMEKERRLMPELPEADLMASFQISIKKSKYCWVDTETILDDPVWQAVIQSRLADRTAPKEGT